ncbi:non-lysosomal glucosylceramidase [Elysia marginata]|uniref:Non-lysosomal glucosylceramidase n=1 Tax=Elysia marginata TaxID=1093978 RepID=A0AAV4H236_9GAST|nr:non-lysosomal glucosylceramidase [Elysia marginata]
MADEAGLQTEPFRVDVFPHGGYDVRVNGVSWLPSGPTFVNSDGKRYCTGEGTLKLLGHQSVTGQDQFGAWNKTTFFYWAGRIGLKTSVKIYTKPSVPVAVFSQTYESDTEKTRGKNRDDIISSFPSFRFQPNTTANLGYLAYGNDMAGWVSLSLGRWSKDAKFSTGIQGGPLVLFDNSSNALVISPLSNFMSASNKKFGGEHLSWGIMGLVDRVPAGHTTDFVVSFSNRGVNQAMRDWGKYLTSIYGKTSDARDKDLTLSHLGYWTDNGAYYYYNTAKGKNYEDTLTDEVAYLKDQGLPVKYLQIDSWFYPKGHVDGTRTWEAKKDIFPHGFKGLYENTSLPIGCHNRYWDNDTLYATYNGGKYNFIPDATSGCAVPDDEQFWIDLFQSTQKWGKFILYEQDWLNKETDRNQALVSDLYLGRRWLTQMGAAAKQFGIAIQYCMSYSRHILQSVEIPAVTQAVWTLHQLNRLEAENILRPVRVQPSNRNK